MGSNLDVAKYYLKKGFSVIPVTKTKNPAIEKWKSYRDMLLEDPEKYTWDGIGFLTGRGNNNAFAIDVDTKYDLTGNLWDRLKVSLDEAIPGILDTLVIVRTISGGYHLIFTCDKVEGNQKLAERLPTNAELSDNPNEKAKAIIETRGEGGYICVAPTLGYELINGKYTEIPHISINDRNIIIRVCKSFDLVGETTTPTTYTKQKDKEEDPGNPYKAFNDKADAKELLTSHGWKFIRKDGDNDYYLRPGKTTSKTSGNWSHKHEKFFCFSSSAGLPTEAPLDLAELYVHLECNGDKTKAYKKLIKEGYGHFPVKKSTEVWWSTSNKGVELEPGLYIDFLESNGFYKYYKDEMSEKPAFIRIVNNIVSLSSPEKIKDFVMNWLEKKELWSVREFCISRIGMFEEKYLRAVKTMQINTLRGDADKDYICYNNGVVVVTKNKVSLLPYDEFDTFIWKSHIIHRDFVFHKDHSNHYQQFIKNVSLEEEQPLESAIGYLISTFKHKSNNRAIILNDAEISDDPNGGSGKGLVIQGVSKLRRTIIIDGKNWSDSASFPYQAVDEDTQILFFDDVKRYFNFENKFSIVTEGITIEKKNKQSFFIPVERSPKLVITTNYVVGGSGNSHERRKIELELAKIYGRDRTPYGDFGCQLFDDWDELHWQKFDNYMVTCLQQYITSGIVEQKGTNIKMKRLINDTHKDFADWAVSCLSGNKQHFNEKTMSDFLKSHSYLKDAKDKSGSAMINPLKWGRWLRKFSEYLDCDFQVGKSNKGRWILYKSDHSSIDSNTAMNSSHTGMISSKSDENSENDVEELPF